jgi:hypothetical protein
LTELRKHSKATEEIKVVAKKYITKWKDAVAKEVKGTGSSAAASPATKKPTGMLQRCLTTREGQQLSGVGKRE